MMTDPSQRFCDQVSFSKSSIPTVERKFCYQTKDEKGITIIDTSICNKNSKFELVSYPTKKRILL